MPDFLSSLSALSLFLIIAAAGFVFLLLSFLIGDLFDHLGTDLVTDHSADGPGLLDSRIISIFLTAFGAFGAIGMQLGCGAIISSLLGLSGGILLGGLAFYFGRLLYRQQASSSISARQLIGRTAEVTVTIYPGKVGQIICRTGGERIEKLARSADNSEIKAGAIVLIEEFTNEAAIVSLYDGPHGFDLSSRNDSMSAGIEKQ